MGMFGEGASGKTRIHQRWAGTAALCGLESGFSRPRDRANGSSGFQGGGEPLLPGGPRRPCPWGAPHRADAQAEGGSRT